MLTLILYVAVAIASLHVVAAVVLGYARSESFIFYAFTITALAGTLGGAYALPIFRATFSVPMRWRLVQRLSASILIAFTIWAAWFIWQLRHADS